MANDSQIEIFETAGIVQPEEWRPITGYEGIYEVSSYGRVRSLPRETVREDGHPRHYEGKIRKAMLHNGYLYISLFKNQKENRFLVHRLVAEAFIPNIYNKKCVDHINTIRTDNRVNNLRWVTHIENQRNPITAKRLAATAKAIIRLAPDGTKKEYAMMKDVVSDGFNLSQVHACCNKQRGFHQGYVWVYKGEEIKDYEFYLREKQARIDAANSNRRKTIFAFNDVESINFSGQKEAVERGFDARAILRCIKTGKTHKGYYWRFK